MKKRNPKHILAAISLAIALTNSMPAYAYSDDELDKVEEGIERYIKEKIENEKQTYESAEEIERYASLYRYYRIQNMISEIPTEYYYELVDSIDTYKTLKNVMKDFIGPDMYDAAKESIIYANIADNTQEILNSFIQFFDSRYNGRRLTSVGPNSETLYPFDEVKTLDNTEGKLNIDKSIYLFYTVTEYGNYRVYTSYSSSIRKDEEYYFITDLNDLVLAYIAKIDNQCSYKYVGDKGVYLKDLKSLLKENNLQKELKYSYSYEDLYTLTFKISEAMQEESENSTKIKAENLYTIEISEDGLRGYNSLADNEESNYFFEYSCPYQFKEGLYVFKDIYNPSALVTIDETGIYGLIYKNYETDVYMKICESDEGKSNGYERLMPINDYLKSKGLDHLIQDEYTKPDLDIINKEIAKKDIKEYKLT